MILDENHLYQCWPQSPTSSAANLKWVEWEFWSDVNTGSARWPKIWYNFMVSHALWWFYHDDDFVMMMFERGKKRPMVNGHRGFLIHFDAEWWKEFISLFWMLVPTVKRPSMDITARHLVILTSASLINWCFVLKIHANSFFTAWYFPHIPRLSYMNDDPGCTENNSILGNCQGLLNPCYQAPLGSATQLPKP